MGTGLLGIDWHEIEAIITNSGLEIELSGKAKLQTSRLRFTNWFANWLGWDDYILVRVIAIDRLYYSPFLPLMQVF